MKRPLTLLAAVIALVAWAVATEALGSVTVLGAGQASACAQAALDGESSRNFEAVCTSALETEMLRPQDRAGTLVNRGVLKLRRGEWDAARIDFDDALRIQPDLGEAYVNRGAAQIGAGQFRAGLVDLDRGLALGVSEPEKAWFNRGVAEEALGDLAAAYADYRQARDLRPGWPAPLAELARFTVSRRSP